MAIIHNLETLIHRTGATYIAVMKVDKAKKLLSCIASYKLPEELVAITNPLDDTTMNGKVWNSGDFIIANSLDKLILGHRITAILIAPIKQDDEVIGTIELISILPDKKFSSDDLNIVKLFIKKEGSSLLR